MRHACLISSRRGDRDRTDRQTADETGTRQQTDNVGKGDTRQHGAAEAKTAAAKTRQLRRQTDSGTRCTNLRVPCRAREAHTAEYACEREEAYITSNLGAAPKCACRCTTAAAVRIAWMRTHRAAACSIRLVCISCCMRMHMQLLRAECRSPRRVGVHVS